MLSDWDGQNQGPHFIAAGPLILLVLRVYFILFFWSPPYHITQLQNIHHGDR